MHNLNRLLKNVGSEKFFFNIAWQKTNKNSIPNFWNNPRKHIKREQQSFLVNCVKNAMEKTHNASSKRQLSNDGRQLVSNYPLNDRYKSSFPMKQQARTFWKMRFIWIQYMRRIQLSSIGERDLIYHLGHILRISTSFAQLFKARFISAWT